MKRLSSIAIANQDISSALLCSSHTADADRLLFVRLFADQIAGDGDYIIYATMQRLGAGSQYLLAPKSTIAIEAGMTSIAFTTHSFPIKSGDIVRVYLQGLPADTTTPDIITEIWEDNSSTLGSGSVEYEITITDGSNPLDSVDVWITTDLAGSNVIARGFTADDGTIQFMLDTGTYYCWKQLAGYGFTNPESFTVS